MALKLKPQYPKVLNRAATCSFHIKDYDQCVDLCDEFLDHNPTDKAILQLRSDAVIAKVSVNINKCKCEIKIEP